MRDYLFVFAALLAAVAVASKLLKTAREKDEQLEQRKKRARSLAEEAFAVAQVLGEEVHWPCLPKEAFLPIVEKVSFPDGPYQFVAGSMRIIGFRRQTLVISKERKVKHEHYWVQVSSKGSPVLTSGFGRQDTYLPGEWEGHLLRLKTRVRWELAERERQRGEREKARKADERRRFGL